MIEYVKLIIIPYVTEKRKELTLKSNNTALVIFDAFKGQCTQEMFQLLQENNIMYVQVPSNCTDKCQPLDLSVNKPAKNYNKAKFQEWYGNIILQQLQTGVQDSRYLTKYNETSDGTVDDGSL